MLGKPNMASALKPIIFIVLAEIMKRSYPKACAKLQNNPPGQATLKVNYSHQELWRLKDYSIRKYTSSEEMSHLSDSINKQSQIRNSRARNISMTPANSS